jgi:hypothetical protein
MQTKKIKIKKETYDRLAKKEKFGDTIDDILNRILDHIDSIEKKNIKTPQMTNTTMHLKTTKKHQWNSPLLNE